MSKKVGNICSFKPQNVLKGQRNAPDKNAHGHTSQTKMTEFSEKQSQQCPQAYPGPSEYLKKTGRGLVKTLPKNIKRNLRPKGRDCLFNVKQDQIWRGGKFRGEDCFKAVVKSEDYRK